MALTVEDGTVVANADSYADLVFVRNYAAKRNLTIHTADADLEVLIIKAMDYLEARGGEYKGCKVSTAQTLQWPRKGNTTSGQYIKVDCMLLNDYTDPDNPVYKIPEQLKRALAQLVIEQAANVPLFPAPVTTTSGSAGQITEKTLGPLTLKYSDKAASTTVNGQTSTRRPIVIATVETLLKPLFGSGCGGAGLYMQTIRA